jgi:hypothetical protein
MKACFPKYSLGPLLAKRLGRCPVWLIVVCFLTVICGSYVLKNYFGLWVIVGLGIAGISVGGSAYVLLDLDKTNGTHRAPARKSMPQSTSGWAYRPKDATRRDAVVDRGGALGVEAVDSGRSSPKENDNVWFNFTNPEPPCEESTTKSPLQADVRKASAYD